MATMNHFIVEDPGDDSPMLPEAAALSHRRPIPKPDSWGFFLSRRQNLALAAALLLGSYSAVLIPAYFPLTRVVSPGQSHLQHNTQALLDRSASLLSDPCRPHWCLTRLQPLSHSSGLMGIPVFLEQDGPVSWDLPPPLGLRGSEETLALALASLPQPGLPPSLLRDGSCRRCVVVGSGGVLHGSRLGAHIDQYDVIIRMNNAPVAGFERDAGSRTTIRLMYPEGAPRSANEYRGTAVVALVVFKSLDLEWLTSVVTKRPLGFWSKFWFWREVVDEVPLEPGSFRILHPEIIHRTGQVLQRYTLTQGNMVPTLGASAVVMALQVCDQVSLAGFGYDMEHPQSRLHYYETIPMGAMEAQVVHDISAEKLFLRDLVASGSVSDLTGAL